MVLAERERDGIVVDVCPQCRGVWLDRGELDKIIEKSRAAEAAVEAAPKPQQRPAYRDDDDGRYRGRRRKSLLSEIFDF
jgi:Zn-finger nucleic acid-binding protein